MLRSDLIHRDHPDSPLSTNKSIFERSAAAWESSRARSHRVTTPNPGLTGFQTPVKQSHDFTEYVMRISVGTPAQHFIAIVDTGSDLVWLQCNCIDCNEQPDPIFRSGNSTSYSPVSCGDPYCVPVSLKLRATPPNINLTLPRLLLCDGGFQGDEVIYTLYPEFLRVNRSHICTHPSRS